MDETRIIKIAAALMMRPDGQVLLVRKRATNMFMQPGGKIDFGETPIQALCRELHEELGISIAPENLNPAGVYTAPAAHEPGYIVQAEIFHCVWAASVRPAAEIEEIIWVNPASVGHVPLAPLTRDHVLPLAIHLACL